MNALHSPNNPQPTESFERIIDYLHATMEAERTGLSRALHDDLGGLLVAAVMDVGWIEHHAQFGEDVRARLKRVLHALAAAVDLKRNVIETLRPTLLDNFGLIAAFRWHLKQRCVRAELPFSESYPEQELKFQASAATALFRIVQETLAVILAEQAVKAVALEVSLSATSLTMALSHEHETVETLDLLADAPEAMGAIQRRISSIGGCVAVRRSASGTALISDYPVARVLA